MGSTIIESDYPHDIIHRGRKDAVRHNKRVNDAVRKQLKDIISQQDIITSEGNRKVKVKLKYLDQYRFRHNPDRADEIGRDEFNDLDEGEIISRPSSGQGKGSKPGDELGQEVYEAEFTIDELTEMMIEELELPDLNDTKKNEITSDIIEYTDLRKRTGVLGCLDKKRTLLAHLKRRAQMNTEDAPIVEDDLRFKTWEISKEKHSNAVVFLMMDRSGSMYDEKIYAVKALYFWLVQFLKKKYDRVEIRFIAHDYNARELQEKDFFSISDDGGTRVSAAYELCKDLIVHNYPQSMWNIYCFHASDGDSWNDEQQCLDLVMELLGLGVNLFGYTEINFEGRSESNLYLLLKKNTKKKPYRVMVSTIVQMPDVINTLQKFLKVNA
jgi:uncharacterized protein